MECKTFNYKTYKACYFDVGNYPHNKQAMSISIISNEGERITACTVSMTDYLYEPDTATIKNYSQNAGMTNFLKKLGIIEDIYSKAKCHPLAEKSETIDYCAINMTKLKEYTKHFDYEWDI